MVLGIGIDIIEIARVEKACKRDAFLERCYTEAEIQQVRHNPASLAGNFAVKEAVAKVLGTGFRGFGPNSIEVLRDELGRPYVNMYKGAKEKADELGIVRIHVSISNTKETAVAVAVGEGADGMAEYKTEKSASKDS